MVSPGVGDNQEAGLPEGSLDLIGEGARSEAAGKGGSASGRGELQHGSLGKRSRG